MDKELLAKKLYCERVSSLLGDEQMDDDVLAEMWESKASPTEAAKAMQSSDDGFGAAPWLSRYLNRK